MNNISDNTICVFNTHGSDSEWKTRDGEKCTVIRQLTSDESDIDDVGVMYKVKFSDGTVTDAFADELTVFDETFHNAVYTRLLNLAYQIYKREWCESRGFPYNEVQNAFDRGEEYDGQMFVCRNEFEDCEFSDTDYVLSLFRKVLEAE